MTVEPAVENSNAMRPESTESFADDSESDNGQRNNMSGQLQSPASVNLKRVNTFANTVNNGEGGGMDEATVMERLIQEGLVSADERESYELRRNMIDFCEKMGRYGSIFICLSEILYCTWNLFM